MTGGDKPKIVMFDPHPDDADWWAGGTTLKFIEKGFEVHYICVGIAGEKVFDYSRASAKILGVERHFLKIPIAGNLGLESALRDAAVDLLCQIDPKMVFIPSVTDYHREHVRVSRTLVEVLMFGRLALPKFEIYAYDSHENLDPIEIYIDVSSVWERHMESLESFHNFEHKGKIPGNTLMRTKTGRAMILGSARPLKPVMYAEGFRMLRADPYKITSLLEIFGDDFCYRAPAGQHLLNR